MSGSILIFSILETELPMEKMWDVEIMGISAFDLYSVSEV